MCKDNRPYEINPKNLVIDCVIQTMIRYMGIKVSSVACRPLPPTLLFMPVFSLVKVSSACVQCQSAMSECNVLPRRHSILHNVLTRCVFRLTSECNVLTRCVFRFNTLCVSFNVSLGLRTASCTPGWVGLHVILLLTTRALCMCCAVLCVGCAITPLVLAGSLHVWSSPSLASRVKSCRLRTSSASL